MRLVHEQNSRGLMVPLLYLHTVAHLRPVQIVRRLWRLLYHPRPPFVGMAELVLPRGNWKVPARRESSMVAADQAQFLAQTRYLSGPEDWNHPG